MTDEERERTLAWRRELRRPVHSLHHVDSGSGSYLITEACFEHRPHIGYSEERTTAFATAWLDVLDAFCSTVAAWVVLPNHCHALVHTDRVLSLLRALGRLHGRTSHEWNGAEHTRGRQVWCNAAETAMKGERHYFATLNYIHHNPVKHRYVARWTDWLWSSVTDFLSAIGHSEAERLWKSYPIDRYGDGWDDPEM